MKKLNVLWKTENLIDIRELIIPYIHNAINLGWWDEIDVIIWGASQKVVAEYLDIQLDIEAMKHDGIKFFACKTCSDNLCVSSKLMDIGIDVMFTGELLTNRLQSNDQLITF